MLSGLIGYLLAAGSAVLTGSFIVFAKLPSVKLANVDPCVFQMWASFGVFFSSLLSIPFTSSPYSPVVIGYGVLSGGLFVISVAFSFISVELIGVSIAQGVWSGCAIVTSFILGIIAYHDTVHLTKALCGLVILIMGAVVIAWCNEISVKVCGDVGNGEQNTEEANGNTIDDPALITNPLLLHHHGSFDHGGPFTQKFLSPSMSDDDIHSHYPQHRSHPYYVNSGSGVLTPVHHRSSGSIDFSAQLVHPVIQRVKLLSSSAASGGSSASANSSSTGGAGGGGGNNENDTTRGVSDSSDLQQARSPLFVNTNVGLIPDGDLMLLPQAQMQSQQIQHQQHQHHQQQQITAQMQYGHKTFPPSSSSQSPPKLVFQHHQPSNNNHQQSSPSTQANQQHPLPIPPPHQLTHQLTSPRFSPPESGGYYTAANGSSGTGSTGNTSKNASSRNTMNFGAGGAGGGNENDSPTPKFANLIQTQQHPHAHSLSQLSTHQQQQQQQHPPHHSPQPHILHQSSAPQLHTQQVNTVNSSPHMSSSGSSPSPPPHHHAQPSYPYSYSPSPSIYPYTRHDWSRRDSMLSSSSTSSIDELAMKARLRARTHRRRVIGLIFSILVGIFNGSILLPLRLIPSTDRSIDFIPSFGLGAAVIAPMISLPYMYLTRSKKDRGNWAPRETLIPGLAAGVVWNGGNICSIYSISYLGYTIAYPLVQCAIVIAALWGVLVFKEIKGKSVWIISVGTGIVLGGAVLLASSKMSH